MRLLLNKIPFNFHPPAINYSLVIEGYIKESKKKDVSHIFGVVILSLF